MAEFDEALARRQLARLMAAPAAEEAVIRRRHPQCFRLVEHQGAYAEQQPLLTAQSVAFVYTQARNQEHDCCVQHRKPQHYQRQLKVVRQHDGEKHHAH